MKNATKKFLLLSAGICICCHSSGHFKTHPGMPIHITEEGKIVYYAYPNGDRVPDFSYCGYQRSEHPIPYIEAKVYVHPPQGDATAVIQRAIDYVSSLPLQDNQFRGAIQLLPGIYHIEGQLLIRKSGIVLRGSGCNASGGTVLQAKGFTKNELIRILGYDNAKTSDSLKVSDKYVPVNATFIPLASADYNPQIEMFARFKMKSSFHKTKRII